MGDKSGIEWTDATWNPLTGCKAVSEGCDNCYAARQTSGRLKNLPEYEGLAENGVFNGKIRMLPDRLSQPLRWKKPRMVFVNSMSDLFHDSVPDDYIVRVFAIMRRAAQHTFQVLTKRPGRMASLLGSEDFGDQVHEQVLRGLGGRFEMNRFWPLPHVWIGTSVENQKWADVRIPKLLETPAAVRFLSCEPLLGPIDLTRIALENEIANVLGRDPEDVDTGWPPLDGIDWVIVGGESGPGARPMNPNWATGLRDQCRHRDVPFFFKQWGEWYDAQALTNIDVVPDRPTLVGPRWCVVDGYPFYRVGKHQAGRELDGRTWNEMP